MKIAIIGSGISGLTCGHLLADLHDITLFESDSRLGGHTHTHDIQVSSGHYKIDTGFIVCNDRNYPNFFKLMNKVGVEIQPSSMSFSVKSEMNNLEYNGTTLNSLFCQRRNIFNPTFYKMIFEILRFNKEATNYYLETQFDQNDNTTLENYLKENRYTNEFIEHYVMPMGAAIWSASREEMRQLPLKFFVRFFHHHGMLTVDNRPQWFVIKGGSSSYIPKLIEKFKNKIHLNGQVSTVTRVNDQVEIKVKETSYLFDEVIFATHADQTRKILQNQNPIEKEILNGFDYRPNDIFLHTDTSVLPKSKLGHASWNYFIPKEVRNRVAVTYHMNILQGIKSPESFLVSLNMDEYINPNKVLKKIKYSHPVYNLNSVRSQQRWHEINGKDKIHFCGAYWGNGFHEDGVKSALRVSEMLGASL